MRIKSILIKSFRRFTHLEIQGIPPSAKLVVLLGPNGSGKSSLFDALRSKHGDFVREFNSWIDDYHIKVGAPRLQRNETLQVEFHSPMPDSPDAKKRLFYFRSAHRNESDFTVQQLTRQVSALGENRLPRMIDNDAEVQKNYQRVVSQTVAGLYDTGNDASSVKELRERLIGQVRTSMKNVFGDLVLSGVGDPLLNGSFFFDKGTSANFRYMNLSGGEKAAFDILLDVIVKRGEFNDTVYCIDEPELHIHTKLQSTLLRELVSLLPDACQLWISTHSIGMMKTAKDIQTANPDQVAILDFHERDFDKEQIIAPARVSRKLWANALEVALGDLADLIAPKEVVICEGEPVGRARGKNSEFDARCYRLMFADEFPDVEFLSAGSALEVEADRLALVAAIQALVRGITVHRVVDRDDKSDVEVADLQAKGIRVLSRRHLESFLFDDAVLTKLCSELGKPGAVPDVLAAKAAALRSSAGRGNPADDMKSARGEAYTEIKKVLATPSLGNNAEAFCRDTLAPMVRGTAVYAELRKDILGV